ncbi:alpha-ketoglutarate-dependent dioxygenase AlkB family protein [Shewanella surugensis]|uniref:Alpha-ketoglutarate-dependent dioxygenase AlkB n=1 Tax=Shewanella surugensis TaxID=212020 RepID=A0ABT0LID0_9GAMM|nr:alpha-ketoglutarate-dependent dioxygenase AlkB [Shewanella surugensis]MCL1127062.1 alpha-ketoglutarate-dependent dioxygenase AlkB [Shewanella surugensis]
MKQQVLFNDREADVAHSPIIYPSMTLVENYLNLKQIETLILEAQHYSFDKPNITVYGKQYPIPRQQVWFGDEGCDYVFSSLYIKALPWPLYANKLRDKLQRDFGFNANGVLVNRYNDGVDSMGWHSDDEPEIQPRSDIVSVSLGASRDFFIRHKKTQQQHKIMLNSGDMLIMNWPMQDEWEHSLPKRKRVEAPRYNFTFRCVLPYFHGKHPRV